MHFERRAVLLAPLAWASLAAAARAAAPVGNTFDAIVRADVAKGFSGAVLVARGNTILLDKVYGTANGRRLDAHARFWIASAGKQFTAAAIMKCRDRGWLGLDDPISRFFPRGPADKRPITIRQLLAHTSGLDQTYASEGAAGRDDAVTKMLSHPLIDAPGHKFHYSNDNYQLAAAIVEIASGEDYKAFARKELLTPAGLRETGFAGDRGAAGVVPAPAPTPTRLSRSSWGAEGVYSTTGDLFRWYRTIRKGQVLSAQSTADLFDPVVPIQEGHSALGWFVGKTARGATRFFVRGNEDWGPNSLLYAYPDTGSVIVVLTHAGMKNDHQSWSRAVHAELEAALRL